MTRTRYKFLPDDSQPYFISTATVNWLPLFNNPDIAVFLFDSLKFLQANGRITLYAYVLMENHLHLVASAENLAKELSNFKSYTARQSIDYYQAHENQFILDQLALSELEGRQDRQYQFWQKGVMPKRIQSRQVMVQKVEYMHQNPLRRGYVDVPEHWCYSSARNYAGMTGFLDVNMDW
jgi:putative transposase